MPLKIINIEKKSKHIEFRDLEIGEVFRSTIDDRYYLKIRDHLTEKAVCLSTFNMVEFTRSLKTEVIRSEIVMETE